MKKTDIIRKYELNCGVTLLNDNAIDDSKMLEVINELLYWYSGELKNEKLYLKETFLSRIDNYITIDGKQKMIFMEKNDRVSGFNVVMIEDNRHQFIDDDNVKPDFLCVRVKNPYELYLQYKQIYEPNK